MMFVRNCPGFCLAEVGGLKAVYNPLKSSGSFGKILALAIPILLAIGLLFYKLFASSNKKQQGKEAPLLCNTQPSLKIQPPLPLRSQEKSGSVSSAASSQPSIPQTEPVKSSSVSETKKKPLPEPSKSKE